SLDVFIYAVCTTTGTKTATRGQNHSNNRFSPKISTLGFFSDFSKLRGHRSALGVTPDYTIATQPPPPPPCLHVFIILSRSRRLDWSVCRREVTFAKNGCENIPPVPAYIRFTPPVRLDVEALGLLGVMNLLK
uniref:Uncharacterized protein n=1 Tax=Gasterosteus aculeatus TaxID=69293 RepID=G3PIC3_GASAC